MSAKTSDARIQELERLTKLKEELKKKAEKQKAGVQKINDSMDAATRLSLSSSAREAQGRRGKKPATLSNQDVINTHDIAVRRLEEDYAEAGKELAGLKKLME